MAFIHGIATWRRAALVDLAKDTMMMAECLATQPWDRTHTLETPGDCAAAVFVAQSRSDGGEPVLGSRSDVGLHAVADLRLDNARDLVSALRDSRDSSHIQLVLSAYARWGTAAAARLQGDGVVALWDERRRRLLCWRDVAGARPLYYSSSPGQHIVFSSDLRSLRAHPHVGDEIDLAYTRSLVEFGPNFQHPSRTLCSTVRKLPAGCLLIADDTGCRVTAYWDPSQIPERRHRGDHDYVDELRDLVQRAVRCRLPRSDHGVAAHLSGGLDSTSVAVTAERLRRADGRRVDGISWAPPRSLLDRVPLDERDLVDAAAAYGGVRLEYSMSSAADIADVEARDLATRPTTTLQVELSASRRAAERGVDTILSGWGGDELAVYNGKGYFSSLARRGRFPTLWRELSLRSEIHDSSRLSEIRGRVILPLLPDRLAAIANPELRGSPVVWPPYLRPEAAAALASVEPLEPPSLRERPGVRRLQIAKLRFGHLQYRMESWAAHGADLGITYAFPMLDQRIIEFALSIPDHLYFKNGWKRWLYRTAMEGTLPDEVRWNPHKFDAALAVRLRQLRPEAQRMLAQRSQERRDNPYVDVDEMWSDTAIPGWTSAAFLVFATVTPPR